MSKVKIQGNASGTGVLTVTAPNTSTDRTITLPDSTGTLATTADSVGGANGVDFNDNVKARFGTGNDFAIWHDGSHTRFQNDTGNLNVRANVFNVTKSDDSENIILAEADGDVKLYRNNVIHLETLATGVRVPVGGVLFGSDTAASNALDDYEEGTWTPTYTNATASGHRTTGNYIRVGRLCYFTYYSGAVTLSNTGGAAVIGGLPFTIDNVNSNYPVFGYVHGTAVTNCAGWHGDVNQTTMYAVQNDSTGYAPFQTGSKQLMVSGVYMVLEGS